MSRSFEFRQCLQINLITVLKKNGLIQLSAGLDESPMFYRDIRAVMEAQRDLVDILAVFHPRLVKMARSKNRHKRR